MLNLRSAARNLMTSQRFFTSNARSPKVQFMNIIADPQYRFGLLDHAATQYPRVHFSSDVLSYNDDAKSIMEEQAKRAASGMENILQLAYKNRGAYEKENDGPRINGNTIVHVATPEFFFYPALGLFSEEIFHDIILISLQKTLKKLPSWLHFHFGTMPVQITSKIFNGTVINTERPIFINAAIYGNGGESPVVAFYSKKYPYKSFSVSMEDSSEITKEGDPYVHDFDTLDSGYLRCVYSETQEGSGFVKAYDICLDHANGVALEEYTKASNLLIEGNFKGFYAVTSNSVSLEPGKAVFNLVSQTDPIYNLVHTSTQEKRSFFTSPKLEFIGEQRAITIPIKANHMQWVPAKLQVHETVEMSDIAEHTKKRISENCDAVDNTQPPSSRGMK